MHLKVMKFTDIYMAGGLALWPPSHSICKYDGSFLLSHLLQLIKGTDDIDKMISTNFQTKFSFP